MRSVMKRKAEFIKKTALTVIFLAVIMSSFAFGVTENYTTENDPLVSLSYINGVLTPAFEKYVDEKVKNVSVDEIAASLMNNESFKEYIASVIAAQTHGGVSGSSASEEFMTVELAAGKKITANGKCEIIVRKGQAAAFCTSDGAVKDLSANKILSNGDGVTLGNFIEISFSGDAGILSLYTPTEILIRGEFIVGE